MLLSRIYERHKDSPLLEPKFVYGVLFGVTSFSLIARILLGYDLALYQGQVHLQSLLWFCLEFALIYWRLKKIDNFKRLFLAFSFKAFISPPALFDIVLDYIPATAYPTSHKRLRYWLLWCYWS